MRNFRFVIRFPHKNSGTEIEDLVAARVPDSIIVFELEVDEFSTCVCYVHRLYSENVAGERSYPGIIEVLINCDGISWIRISHHDRASGLSADENNRIVAILGNQSGNLVHFDHCYLDCGLDAED